MKITTKVSFGEYARLLFSLTYQRPIMKVLVGIAILLLLWVACYYFGLLDLPEPLIYQFATLVLILVVQPIVIFTTIRKTYHSSNHISEILKMEILKDEIRIVGESFYMEVRWDKMFKIVEKPKWFLIYQNSLSAIIVPKKDLTSNEKETFIQTLKGLKNVPVELIG
ncbi:YcxB family protein [Flavobacterium selenitireducens]|uniref:YcxB family protein n=1 Tax=Flavobacterium selenitireducens TaxID=2722704 RepID=UPI00168ABD0A|nr:YcxB family protein [Flavobacterium selenitireducens]MBD3583891.1 YcxB family protein [Flavobacterium selenitireducens]